VALTKIEKEKIVLEVKEVASKASSLVISQRSEKMPPKPVFIYK